jgi:pSer/pThr/pTyr-binding forkhead associated (FHA) protein
LSEFVFIEQAPSEGAEHAVESGWTIGREGCDISVTDSDVSRKHAEVEIVAGELSIQDLGSTNGTYVNGERIDQPRRLSSGDEIRMGSTVWLLRGPAGETRVADAMSDAERNATMVSQDAIPPSAAEPVTADQPTALSPPREEAPTPAREAAPPAREAAPAPAPAAASRSRGDVPQPDFAPSAIRRIVPVDAPPAFTPESQAGRRGSAATRGGATFFTTAVIALTTAGVILYYNTEPFK